MQAFLALGSNLGDSKSIFEAMPAALRSRSVFLVNASRVYQTKPVGGPDDQPDFLNQVLEVKTMCSVRELFDACKAIEFAYGRNRDAEVPNGPRTLDIDLLLIEDQEINERDLVIPHPRMHERAFVLEPLAEIAPDVAIPGHGTPASLLVALPDTSDVRPIT